MAKFDTKDRMITDFGIDLEGARKDNAVTADIDGMTVHEMEQKIIKKNLWPEPDWLKLLQSNANYSADVLYYCRMIRDKLKARPNIKGLRDTDGIRERCKEYANVVFNLRTACTELYRQGNTADDILLTLEAVEKQVTDVKLAKNIDLLKGIERRKTNDAARLQNFPYQTVSKLKFAYLQEHIELNPQGQPVAYYTISKKTRNGAPVSIVSERFNTRDEAYIYAVKNIQSKGYSRKAPDMSKMVYLMRPELENIDRIGPDIRNNINVLDLDMLSEFNIAGGEFGTWNSQKDRQAVLNYTYDAFCDLAHILNVPHRMIGLESSTGAKLSVSYGARGSGWQESAKYMKDAGGHEIIHIQKIKGAGWIARAYGTAVDNYIGALYNGRGIKEPMSWYMLRNMNIPGDPAIYAAFEALYDEMLASGYLKKLRSTGESVMYRAFPFCFEAYVEDQLTGNHLRNDYLVHSTQSAGQNQSGAVFSSMFPQGEARDRIMSAMHNLLDIVFHGKTAEQPDDTADEDKAYADYNNYAVYSHNVVSAEEMEDITDTNAKTSRLNFKARLQRLGNIDSSYKASAEDIDTAYAWLLKRLAGNLGCKIVTADTRQLVDHYKADYFITKDNKALVLNTVAGPAAKLKNAVSGAVDYRLKEVNTGLNDAVTDDIVKEAVTYYICGLVGIDLGDAYCTSDIFTAISKDSVLTGRLLDEVNSMTRSLLAVPKPADQIPA